MTGGHRPIFVRKIKVKFFSYNCPFEKGSRLNKSHQILRLQSSEKNSESESKLSLHINHRQKKLIQGITSSLDL